MTQAEKMLVFGLGALFHAARIAGGSARGESAFPSAANSFEEAENFLRHAKHNDVAPDLPADDGKPRRG